MTPAGSRGTHLVIVDENRTNPEWLFDLFYYHGEHAAELAADYVEHFFSRDERVARLLRLPDRHIVPMADLYTESELKTSPAYNDLLRRTGARHGLNVRMDGPDGTNIVWVTTDPTRREGWTTAQIHMIKRLLPHVRQFVRVRHGFLESESSEPSDSGCWIPHRFVMGFPRCFASSGMRVSQVPSS